MAPPSRTPYQGEQLRTASSRERAIEELKGPCEIPWTISSLASHPQRSTYWDITSEVPSDLQWQEASEHPTGRRRVTGKRTTPLLDDRPSRPRLDASSKLFSCYLGLQSLTGIAGWGPLCFVGSRLMSGLLPPASLLTSGKSGVRQTFPRTPKC